MFSFYPPETKLSIGGIRNIKPQGQSGGKKEKKSVILASLLMFASRKPVTYLADYRKLHSKWQKWGESDNINQPFDYRTCKKLSKSNYLP